MKVFFLSLFTVNILETNFGIVYRYQIQNTFPLVKFKNVFKIETVE